MVHVYTLACFALRWYTPPMNPCRLLLCVNNKNNNSYYHTYTYIYVEKHLQYIRIVYDGWFVYTLRYYCSSNGCLYYFFFFYKCHSSCDWHFSDSFLVQIIVHRNYHKHLPICFIPKLIISVNILNRMIQSQNVISYHRKKNYILQTTWFRIWKRKRKLHLCVEYLFTLYTKYYLIKHTA